MMKSYEKKMKGNKQIFYNQAYLIVNNAKMILTVLPIDSENFKLKILDSELNVEYISEKIENSVISNFLDEKLTYQTYDVLIFLKDFAMRNKAGIIYENISLGKISLIFWYDHKKYTENLSKFGKKIGEQVDSGISYLNNSLYVICNENYHYYCNLKSINNSGLKQFKSELSLIKIKNLSSIKMKNDLLTQNGKLSKNNLFSNTNFLELNKQQDSTNMINGSCRNILTSSNANINSNINIMNSEITPTNNDYDPFRIIKRRSSVFNETTNNKFNELKQSLNIKENNTEVNNNFKSNNKQNEDIVFKNKKYSNDKEIENGKTNDKFKKTVGNGNPTFIKIFDENFLKPTIYNNLISTKKTSKQINYLEDFNKIDEDSDAVLEEIKKSEFKKIKNLQFVNEARNEHFDSVTSIIILNEEVFVTGSLDFSVVIWDIKSLKAISIFNCHRYKVTCLLKLNDDLFISGSYDTTIKLYSYSKDKMIKTIYYHKYCVTSLEFFIKTKINHSNYFASTSYMEMVVWNMDFEISYVVKIDECKFISNCVFLKSNSNILLTIDKVINVYNIEYNMVYQINDHTTRIKFIEVLNDHQFATVELMKIKIWDINTYKCVTIFIISPFDISYISRLNDRQFVVCSLNNLKIYDLKSKTCVKEIEKAHSGWITCCKLINKEIIITCCSKDNYNDNDISIKFWRNTNLAKC